MKLFSKIATLFAGIAMAVAVGVGINSGGNETKVNAADSGLTPSEGVFIIDFYNSDKLTSTSGTALTSSNYLQFVKVNEGLTAKEVVTGVSVSGTVQYGKNGGLTVGGGNANSDNVSFSIGSEYKVNKCTVYATKYEDGVWKLNGSAAGSGSLGSKGATFNNVKTPLIWDELGGITTLAFTKSTTTGGTMKRLTIYTIVCEYSAATPKTLTNVRISDSSLAKKSYFVGQKFDGSNIVAYASWDNEEDTSKNISEDIVWNDNEPLTEGETEVVGYYSKDKNEDFPLTITGISVKGALEFSLYQEENVIEGDYIICSDDFAMRAESDGSSRLVGKSVGIENNVISCTDDLLIWHFSQNGDNWNLYNSGSKSYAGSTSAKNTGVLLDEINDFSTWSISSFSSGIYTIVNVGRSKATSDSGNKFLRCNSNTTNHFYASYGSGTGKAPSLYKLVDDRVLDSISVSGTISKTEYNSDESWSADGLSVTAYFEGGSDENVTSDVLWSFTPEKPSSGVTSVVCTASYTFNEVTKTADSEPQAVTVKKVKEVKVNNVEITDPSTSPVEVRGDIALNEKKTLSAKVNYEQGDDYKDGNNKVTWSSNNTNVISIDATTGVATFKADGTATIIATSAEDSTKTASVVYDVKLRGLSKEYPLGITEVINGFSTLKYENTNLFVTGFYTDYYETDNNKKYAYIRDSMSTTGDKIEIYSKNGVEFVDCLESEYIIGSKVTAYGKFTYFSSAKIYEITDIDANTNHTKVVDIVTEPVTSISIQTPPSKTAYNYGETFSPTGLVIKAKRAHDTTGINYAYSSTSDRFSFSPTLDTPLTENTTITVTFDGKSATVNVTVTKVLDSIEKDASSTVETSYFEDDKFDPTGLVITTNYENEAPSGTVEYNDTTKSKFGFEPSLSTALTAADDIVTVSYTENGVKKSFDLDIEVAAPGTKAVEVTTQPGKVSYYEGDEFDPSGLVLTLTLENDKTTTVAYNDTTAKDFSFTYDGSAINPGDVLDTVGNNQEISVTYDGVTTAAGKGILINVAAVELTSIKVKTNPTKTTYNHGDIFEPDGLVITASYNNKTTNEIPYTEGCGMTFDKDELSYTDTEITVTYENCDDKFDITVNRVIDDVEFISIKDTYVVDQKFDPSNLEVELSFTDEGPTEVITYADNPELFTDFDPALDLPLKADDTSISFKIKGHTATHELTVNNRTMISATIKTEQAKDTYFRGESFDASGLVIHAVYNDGSEDDIAYASGSTAWTFAPATFEEVGDDVPVSISYNNISCGEVVVTVNEVVLSSISVKTAPTKLEYDFGEKFAPEGLEIELLFNNGRKETVTYAGHESEFTFNPGLDHELTHDDHAITITYQEKSTTQDITVNKVKSSAKVTANPTKTTYVEGTYFNPAGLEATITFSDNSTEVVKFNDNPERFTDWSIPVEQKLSVSDEKVTFKVDDFALEVDITVVPASVTSIAVKKQPKVAYKFGETFNPEGLVITASFDNGTTQDVEYKNETKDAFTFSIAPGTKLTHENTEVSITYASKSTTLSLTIDKVVTSIEVASMPSKVTYTVGETFDPTGLTIKANYSDESNALVTGYSLSEVDMSTPGNKTVTVTYEGKTCEFNITVNEAPAPVKTLVSIAVTHMPNKVEYEVGDTFNRDGLEITATYSDETTAVITDYGISSPDMSTPGNKTVTVTYQEKTCEFTITVKQPAPVKTLESIEVSKLPNKVEYNIGEPFDSTGLEVTAKYSDGSSEKVTGYTLSSVDMTSAGTKSVTVTYETKTTSFNITVKEAPAPVVTLTGISATEPTKEYNVGDTIAPEDITVKATYSDGSSKNVTGWTSGQITKVSDTQGQVTISYTEGEVTKSTIIFVNIKQEQPAPKPLGCGGSVIAASGLVSIVSLLGASLLVLKKRKEK